MFKRLINSRPKYWILLALLCVCGLQSCDSDDDMDPEEVEMLSPCSIPPESSGMEPPCQTNPPIGICESIRVDDTDLSENTRSWGAFYCEQFGEEIVFVNNVGVEVTFLVAEFRWTRSLSSQNSFTPCSEGSGNIFFCNEQEKMGISFQSTESEEEFLFTLRTIFNGEVLDGSEIADQIDIGIKDVSASAANLATSYSVQFSVNIEDAPGSPKYKFYLSREDGLVAYITDLGELWVIKE